ncbi:MAG TPA: Gfo/Idh/MocA family oxidoreductase [Phenylobacterium sp.]|uniref:Gfo/Idh/MocA family protein n=1 Tax=Phenylobacterium sp. TaxID=1871053 RepID=UPI002B4708ED|nr:Gfo/Idh/MocA family oxidoreductase [Phenylobacterium sp.]HKR89252.1 Gfo/Idh/MocA family oxidoreductase [Phenylobacterium sp.]
MSPKIQLGLVGLGKIARDQHLPAISRTPGIELVAVASPHARAEGVRNYAEVGEMLAAEPHLDAVVMCQPPQPRFDAARQAIAAGKHVFLEKPPGATICAVEALISLADEKGLTLFASWHSRYAAAVAPARAWLAGRTLRRAAITWKEDVRRWHPGQTWIFDAGGFGVFDPGINALSILTEVVRDPIVLSAAELEVPSNRAAPIAAKLALKTVEGAPIEAVFDFRQTGLQTWNISIETNQGELLLSEGGDRLAIDGVAQDCGPEGEYPAMYRHFVDLVQHRRSDVDLAPLRLVADAFLSGRFRPTDPFEE